MKSMTMRDLPEADWKYMKRLKPELLNELCEQSNAAVIAILQQTTGTPHERYLKAFECIHEYDDIIAECFDDWRRSKLILRISSLVAHQLISDEQLTGLTDETRAIVQLLSE